MAEKVFESVATRQLEVGTEQFQAGKTGRPAFFFAKTNVKLGGWFNASKSYMDCDTSGSVTGLMSAHNMELRLPNSTISWGAYSPVEANLVFQTNTSLAPAGYSALAWFQVSGTQAKIDAWEDESKACLFMIRGLTANDASIFSLNANLTKKGALKIIIGTTPYYIMLASSPTS